MANVSSSNEKLIRLLEEQPAYSNQQNLELSKKLGETLKQNEALAEQLTSPINKDSIWISIR
ncbi:hypothetical protein [Psychrobacillus sp. NPDC093180]|uniref:hypothetical protein n=1 Tax=Psychrobacillus sp. NPDC093180 TaxID=3364489 RepID=UPI00382E57A1